MDLYYLPGKIDWNAVLVQKFNISLIFYRKRTMPCRSNDRCQCWSESQLEAPEFDDWGSYEA